MNKQMSSITECEIIQKQQAYIKELEQKINAMTNQRLMLTWVQVRKMAEHRIEAIGLDRHKSYGLWSGVTSITSKALKKQSVTGLVGEDAEKANNIVNDILDVFEKYYKEENQNE